MAAKRPLAQLVYSGTSEAMALNIPIVHSTIYIYIYTHMCIYIYMYIYIYTYILLCRRVQVRVVRVEGEGLAVSHDDRRRPELLKRGFRFGFA